MEGIFFLLNLGVGVGWFFINFIEKVKEYYFFIKVKVFILILNFKILYWVEDRSWSDSDIEMKWSEIVIDNKVRSSGR